MACIAFVLVFLVMFEPNRADVPKLPQPLQDKTEYIGFSTKRLIDSSTKAEVVVASRDIPGTSIGCVDLKIGNFEFQAYCGKDQGLKVGKVVKVITVRLQKNDEMINSAYVVMDDNVEK
jgi:hypothetical protein